MKSHHRVRADRAALTAIAVIVLDQLAKWLAFSATDSGDALNVIPGLTISQTRNTGIAFGFFSGRPWLVLGLMAAALAVLLWFYAGHRTRPVLWLATGLLMGGALGNAIDRIALGYVRDFVNLPNFPSFNLADAAITCGVIVLVLAAESKDETSEADGVPDGDPSTDAVSGTAANGDERHV